MADKCRFCANKICCSFAENIFEESNFGIRSIIKEFTGIEMVMKEPLPKHICGTCLLSLKQAAGFRQLILESHEDVHQDLPSTSSGVMAAIPAATTIQSNILVKRENAKSVSVMQNATEDNLMEWGMEMVLETPLIKDICAICLLNLKPAASFQQVILNLHEDLSTPAINALAASPTATNNESDTSMKSKLAESGSGMEIARVVSLVAMMPDPHHEPTASRSKKSRLDKKYVCDRCGLRFRTKGNMMIHKLRHNDKNFICETCGRMFYMKPTMQMHIRVCHRGEEPYSCKYCDMAFKSSATRCRHERIMHPDELPFICELCDIRFNKRRGWIRHQEWHKTNLPYCTSITLANTTATIDLSQENRNVEIGKDQDENNQCDGEQFPEDVEPLQDSNSY